MLEIGNAVRVINSDSVHDGKVSTIERIFSVGGERCFYLTGIPYVFIEEELESADNNPYSRDIKVTFTEGVALTNIDDVLIAVSIHDGDKDAAVARLLDIAKKVSA